MGTSDCYKWQVNLHQVAAQMSRETVLQIGLHAEIFLFLTGRDTPFGTGKSYYMLKE